METQLQVQFKGPFVVAASVPLWGHTKALCGLLARMVRVARAEVTFFIGLSVLERVEKEIRGHFRPGKDEDEMVSMIKIIALDEPKKPFDFDAFNSAFMTSLRPMLFGESCNGDSDNDRKLVRRPQLVILQFFMYQAMKRIRELLHVVDFPSSTPSREFGLRKHIHVHIPILVWQPVSAAGALVRFGPEEYGGNGDLSIKVQLIDSNLKGKLIDEEDGKRRNEEAEKVYNRINGDVISIPGLPEMYDYEHSPQQIVRSSSAAFYAQYVYRMFQEGDGVILGTNTAYEGPAIELWKKWFGDRPVFCVGPMMPLVASASEVRVSTNNKEGELEVPEEDTRDDVMRFMDRALQKFGVHSIVYISFGTVWWPAEPEKIWVILDVLMELSIPFIFAQASPSGTVPESVTSKVEKSGLGYIASWLPQQRVLRHKACGWILTHCGHNSVMEALSEGVPLICWPFLADQPSNAAIISSTHNVGYELFEVRSGCGLWPIKRWSDRAPEGTLEAVRREAVEVFGKARGVDGERKRENARRLKKEFEKVWKMGVDGGVDGDRDGMGYGWEEVKRIFTFV